MERPRVTRRALMWWVGPLALVASAVFLVRSADLPSLQRTWDAALAAPLALALVLALYATAFLVRALTWCRTLPGLSLAHSLAALHVSLLGNHVLPLRLGEALRVTSVVRRARIPVASATASTVLLRAADVLAVAVLATAFSPDLVDSLIGGWSWVVMAFAVALWVAGAWWLRRLRRDRRVELRTSTVLVSVAAPAAWVLESAVVWQAARWAGMDISFPQAILVTAVTIAAQVVAITPGGIGTYEAAATASFVALGSGPEPAFAAAVTAHAIKTAYSL
ncbi:MAG TPA: lysylphosphatidylglycerol synthase domain-containing protein, partial [Actinomycetota bacterium]|nr:lysylphosphatidylglycerol synthase domain-containing protein [Actinomycetota bacterium]